MATKNIKREALRILQQFQVAGKLSTVAEISDYKLVKPRPSTQLIWVVFLKTAYIAAIDNNADDDTIGLLESIHSEFPGVKGVFLRNPNEDSFETYGVRHKFHDTYLFEVKPTATRLDKEMARRNPGLSRATIQKYIKAGYVTVNGSVVTKNKADVNQLSQIALALPQKRDTSDDELPIIYLDDNVIVVNKPAGILTHSKGAMNDEFTVADFFRRYSTNALETTRPGIVHRLDRDTSGLIIGARNDHAAQLLKKQFSDRTVHKSYVAIVDGVPKLDNALIDLPIARNPSAPSTFRVDPRGKSAVTSYTVIESNGQQTSLELRPKTGRTHQLRVHMQYIKTPIAGDRVYGSKASAHRLMLHAHKLEITLPHGKRMTFEAPIPDDFKLLGR